MSKSILVIGESGSGKTTSAYFLNPEETYYINADGNGLPFPGWQKMYNKERKNYFEGSDIEHIEQILKGISSTRPDIKVVVIDTINAIMIDKEMSVNFKNRKSGNEAREKWLDLAMEVYDLVLLSRTLRDDITVIFMGHIATYTDNYGVEKVGLVTNGRKLEKIQLESKFKIVLLTKVEAQGNGKNKYYFETQANNSRAKSPMGMFPFIIKNNLKYVVDRINEYYNGETEIDLSGILKEEEEING